MECKLRRLKEDDLPYMLEWMRDPSISKCFRSETVNKSSTEVLDFIRNSEYDINNGANIHYAIANAEDVYLGTISLKNINLIDQNAEYAIAIRKCAQGKGIGTRATCLILNKAFNEFQMENVYLNVLENNDNAIRFYEKIGFKRLWNKKKYINTKEDPNDVRWYIISKTDFLN